MLKKLERDDFLEMDRPILVMLEDKRMGLVNHLHEEHALVDVYSGNDHDGQLHIPYRNFMDVPMIGLLAGLKGVDRSDDAAAPKDTVPSFIRRHDDPDLPDYIKARYR